MTVHIEGVKEAPVVGADLAEFEGIFVGEGPAYVVVRADVVYPGAIAGYIVSFLDGLV